MSIAITRAIVDHLGRFPDDFCDFFVRNLEPYVGSSLQYKDLCFLYVQCIAKCHDYYKDSQLGSLYFVEDIRHSKRHFMWFALLSPNGEVFRALVNEFERIETKDIAYLYEYFFAIRRSDDDVSFVHPDLKAQFESQLSSAILPPPSANVRDHAQKDNMLVYFWSPPTS